MSVAKVPQPGLSRWVRFRRALIRDRWLYLIMILPCLYYLLFHYYPMYGVTLAFKQYKPKLGIIGSPWASQHGMKYILQVVNDPYFWTVFKNTIVLNVVNLAITFPAPIILALLLNEVASNRYKRVVQTVTYLPHFLSTVVVVGMMNTMFSSSGIVNELLGKIGLGPFAFLNDAQYFRPMYIGSNIWQNIGWDSIIFLAALSGLDQALYEAARIDGAGRWKQTLHITLPGIAPFIALMTILSIGGILSAGFDQIFNMYNPAVYETGDIIDTLTYRLGLVNQQYSLSAAVGLMRSIVSCALVLTSYKLADKYAGYRVW